MYRASVLQRSFHHGKKFCITHICISAARLNIRPCSTSNVIRLVGSDVMEVQELNGKAPVALPLEKYDKDETIRLRSKLIGPSCKLFFKNNPIKIVRAKDQYMYDEQGNSYLDCINNVASVGHCHPAVVRAGAAQMATLSTNSRFLHDNILSFAHTINETMPPNLSVWLTGQSTAWAEGRRPPSLPFLAVCFWGDWLKCDSFGVASAYHGHISTLIEISPYKFKAPGSKVTQPDYVHIADVPDNYRGRYRNDVHTEEELADLYADEVKVIIERLAEKGQGVCAYIAESMQSCGGQIVMPPGYMEKVFKYVHDAGGVCIADEVQVGCGRVGEAMWGFQMYGECRQTPPSPWCV
ncbi:PREDICTED: ethanolamine-phosphate phospho-lyase-like [Priapulus caudatus]|uniref:Ethanolamine-phosphate phospho-lyase-like n=1 Tax=Priapulus caudatus TaxID=37621 RepID=A0ABM1EJE1_PRICU|nr:PREDICTED: ethanolamine-phosphate phospho-lyase-like [Priapulus caudatus]